jgi:hypothetical protein
MKNVAAAPRLDTHPWIVVITRTRLAKRWVASA